MSKNQIDTQAFKFSMPIPVRWNDMDALGHVNNIYYFEYFQIARGEYMPTVSPAWDWTKHMFVIAHIECDFMQELSLRHKNPVIKARTVAMSNKSFTMEYIVTSLDSEGNETLHAKGMSVNVLIDIQAKKSIPAPHWFRENLEKYEGLSFGL